MEKPKRTFLPTQYISNDIKCKMFQLKDKDFQIGEKNPTIYCSEETCLKHKDIKN